MIELLNIDCIDYLLNLNRNIVIIGNEESKIKGMQQYLQKLLGSELQCDVLSGDRYYESLYYENIFLLVLPIGRWEEKVWKDKLEELGYKNYQDFMIYRNGGHESDWDYLDINCGYTYAFGDTVGYKKYGDYGKKIIILGGSTSCHYEQLGVCCWPELLFELLKNSNCACQVYNGAISGYRSDQDLLKLIRDVDKIKPELIITLTGLNDAVVTSSTKIGGAHLEQMFNSFSKNIHSYMLPVYYGSDMKTDNVSSWLMNMKYMQSIAQINGSQFMAFLQPTLANSNYQKNYDEEYFVGQKDIQKNMNDCINFYDEVKRVLINNKDYSFIKDLSDIFVGYSGLFRDRFHVYEMGNAIIAKCIYEEIRNQI